MVSFPPVSPIRPCTPPSPSLYAPHAQTISFFSILSPAQYWVRSTNHLAPPYAISSIPPLPIQHYYQEITNESLKYINESLTTWPLIETTGHPFSIERDIQNCRTLSKIQIFSSTFVLKKYLSSYSLSSS